MATRIVADDRIASFVAEELGAQFIPPYTLMGLERDGVIVAGVVFHVFEGANVHVTIAGHGWTRSFLREAGHYVFNVLGCERFSITTEHAYVARLGERLGGAIEGYARNQFGKGRNAFLVGVLKDEYRFK